MDLKILRIQKYPNTCKLRRDLVRHWIKIKGAVSEQSNSFCLILPVARRQSLWNLK